MKLLTQNVDSRNGKGTMTSIKVLVVSDQPLVRLGILSLLNVDPQLFSCGEACDAAGAMKMAAEQAPKLIVVDVHLKGRIDLKLIKKLREDQPQVFILAISMQTDSLFAGQVLAAGANGYVTGEDDAKSVAEALKTVARGRTYLSANLVQRFTPTMANHAPLEAKDPASLLTERELQVFELIGSGQSTKRIAGQLKLSVHTVETYRERIRAKLGVDDGSEMAYHAIVWQLLNT